MSFWGGLKGGRQGQGMARGSGRCAHTLPPTPRLRAGPRGPVCEARKLRSLQGRAGGGVQATSTGAGPRLDAPASSDAGLPHYLGLSLPIC